MEPGNDLLTRLVILGALAGTLLLPAYLITRFIMAKSSNPPKYKYKFTFSMKGKSAVVESDWLEPPHSHFYRQGLAASRMVNMNLLDIQKEKV